MQIQTVEEQTGLDRATIRYYEQEGLIKPQRLQNGYRDYSEKHLQDLMKIKLLRQLGLSLETIVQLIEGKDDLQTVLDKQLVVLKVHRAQVDNAEAICKMILQDQVTYETIVPNKYFVVNSEKKCIENDVIETPYTEYVYLESHPVRRFVGRYLDQLLTSAILMLIFVVLMRVRPFGDTQNRLLSIAAVFLTMPINALFLCLFGTTPGKFTVGIFLKTPEGKNMPFLDALQREWAVFRHGMGFGIPFYSWVRLYKSYKIHTDGRELEWDYDYNADVLYTEWDTKRGVFSTILAIICAITIGFSAVDAQLPKHRNENLTLAQFAENYNVYAKQMGMSSISGRLTEQGIWYTPYSTPRLDNNSTVVIEEYTQDRLIEDINWSFITGEHDVLNEISIKIRANSVLSVNSALSGKISLAVYTAILSQPRGTLQSADEAVKVLSDHIYITDREDKYYQFGDISVNIIIQDLPDGIYGADVLITIP